MRRIGSGPRAFQRAVDGVHMLPLSPEMDGSKSYFLCCLAKMHFRRINSVTEFLCVKTSSGKVVV